MMSHPESCHDPNCALTYREHLINIGFTADAMPTRLTNRTPGQPDEPAIQTSRRERRWVKDIDAYKRLHAQGYRPPRVDGSAFREKHAESALDIEHRPVTVDYLDPPK